MPKIPKHEIAPKLLDIGLLPAFYNGDIKTAKKIIQACFEGGAKVVEFTNRGDFAYRIFSDLARWCNSEFSDIVIGVGTIVDPATATLYINNGANFIVGPTFSPGIAKICNRCKILYIPGCLSPSEILNAQDVGADIIKVFPARSLGPNFIKSVLGPCPQAKLMPSGGVEFSRENIFSWIKAGASVLNMGSDLIRKDLVKAEKFDEIKEMVRQCVSYIEEARRSLRT